MKLKELGQKISEVSKKIDNGINNINHKISDVPNKISSIAQRASSITEVKHQNNINDNIEKINDNLNQNKISFENQNNLNHNQIQKQYYIFFENITSEIINGNFISDYVVLDLETTGLYSYLDKITEFSILKIKNNELIDEMTHLVNPNIRIPNMVTNITGINNDMVKNEKTIKFYLNDIIKFIDNNVIIGHNITFDLNFLEKAIQDNHILTDNIEFKYIDTLELSRNIIFDTPDHKLKTLKRYLKIDNISHRGRDDCDTTKKLYDFLIDQLKEEMELKKLEYENKLKNLNDNENNFINFIKEKIKEIDETLKIDIDFQKDYTMKFNVNNIYIGKVKLRGKNFKIELVTKNNVFLLDNINYDEACKHSEKWIKYLKKELNLK